MEALNWCFGKKPATQLTALLLLAVLFLAGCKPRSSQPKAESPPLVQVSPAPGPNRAVTNLSSCLSEMDRDQDSAVAKFLALDLSQVQLFSPDTPLAYSEAEFAALQPAFAAETIKRVSADLHIVKMLARELKTRRDDARTSGDSALAERYNAKLSQLGSRLQGPENLKLTQLVGAAISKLAAQ